MSPRVLFPAREGPALADNSSATLTPGGVLHLAALALAEASHPIPRVPLRGPELLWAAGEPTGPGTAGSK